MNTELSAIMSTEGRLVEWASKVKYGGDMASEDKEISAVLDNWAKEVGKTGYDQNHEISQLVRKTITPETVSAPSELLDSLFDQSSIGEFDDIRAEVDPENTIKVYDAVTGGNVDRSFIDHKVMEPTWSSLQAETDISLADMRKGGYKTVANMVAFINEALEMNKICRILALVDAAVTSGHAGYVAETTSNITETSADKLALYLADVSLGDTPYIFGLNKYIQTIAGFDKAIKYATDPVKNQFNATGFLAQYAGCQLTGFSGVRKLANGSLIVPDKRVFGAAGKIGQAITRGDTNVYQETDINSEKIHIKVNGYTFGTVLTNPEMVGKIAIA